MFKNYLKVAIRNLRKYKAQSVINIAGLSVGMAVALLIGLWIWDELSFNKYHRNHDRIAQVLSNAKYNGEIYTINSHPMPLGFELQRSYGRDFKYVVMSTAIERHMLAAGEKKFAENGRYMQSAAPDMLTLKMLNGSRSGLKEQNSVLLSSSLAKKLFGDTDPVNKMIKIDNAFEVKVTGVYEDLPDNSDFKDLSYIAPFDFYLSCYDWARKKSTDWNNICINLFVQLNPGAGFGQTSSGIKNVLATHVTGGDFAKRKPTLFLQPMSRWHLYSNFANGVNITSAQLQFVWFYGIIGAFVLLLACINFMNLSTARSEQRAKEVGIRKTMGSARGQLIGQFFSESLVAAALSFLGALFLVQLSLPWFNEVAGKKIQVLWSNPFFWAAGIAFVFITGILAGSYPALYLSSFKPVKVLKGSVKFGRLAALPRKALVVLQFTVSIMLFIGTVIVYRQIQFAKQRPTGYAPANLLQVPINSPEFQGNYTVVGNELKNAGLASEVAESASPVTSIWSTGTGFTGRGKPNTATIEFATICVSQDYGKAIGWQLVAGRDFSDHQATDSSGFVINEAAAKLLGLPKPVGETLEWDQVKGQPFKILGVIKDMVTESPYNPIAPAIYFIYQRDGFNFMFLKLNPHSNPANAVAKISDVFKKIDPNTSFEYSFVNEEFNRKFAAEERIGTLAGCFAGLAILISCLGLFGLVSFIAEQRTKEIGVRKVLGASVFQLWRVLNKGFVTQVTVALAIAIPAAWYFMGNWLQHYAYRSDMPWWIFASAAAGAIAITLLTASYQSIRTAMTNPAKSLRAE